jgi:uncharacterized membrane protein YsdA (DUF1294 family)/cold shock CspA family protein
MSESLTARIVEWNADKGYGFVDTGTRRVFLHVRDFAERHKRPEVGDVIVFTLGTDSQGRTCAVHAVHHNDGGRIRLRHLLLLLALLVSPGLAIWRLAPIVNVPLLLGLWALVSLVTYALYASDRQRARAGEWRVPEAMLHFAELVGGWPGAFLAQRRLRHKCAKLGFQVVFWLIVAIHVYAATDYQLNWRLARSAQQFLHQGRTEPGKS